jgi:hypothetical protein
MPDLTACPTCDRWDGTHSLRCYLSRSAPSEARPATTLHTPSEGPSSGPAIPGTSTTIFRRGRAGKPGRPPVPAAEQRQKARDRDRAYCARQRQSPSADGLSTNPQPAQP